MYFKRSHRVEAQQNVELSRYSLLREKKYISRLLPLHQWIKLRNCELCAWYNVLTMWSLVMYIVTFRLHTAGLHQEMRSNGYASWLDCYISFLVHLPTGERAIFFFVSKIRRYCCNLLKKFTSFSFSFYFIGERHTRHCFQMTSGLPLRSMCLD